MKQAFAIFIVALQCSLAAQDKFVFDNNYLRIDVLPGWKARRPHSANTFANATAVNITKGRYILYINPLFGHASGIIGGRFDEIARGMPSVDSVMANVDRPAAGDECGSIKRMRVTKTIVLGNLYADKSKKGTLQHSCNFPSDATPAWFGALMSGATPGENGHDYAITVAYDTTDVQSLPKEDSAELKLVLNEVSAMLKTLVLKPPLVISRMEPTSGPPGTLVTLYGTGFGLPGGAVVVLFKAFPNNPMPPPSISSDGRTLRFQVPSSIDLISCQPGYIDIDGNCVPIPPNHGDANECPPSETQAANFCGKPIPPRRYELFAEIEGMGVTSNRVEFAVTEPTPTGVTILLVYPNQLVSPGDVITVRGSGFTPKGNAVTIGSSAVPDVDSDGTTLRFAAPEPSGASIIEHGSVYGLSVSNINGRSNSISLGYRHAPR